MRSGNGAVNDNELKEISSYFWRNKKLNKKIPGYEAFAEELEKSNKTSHWDTAAQIYAFHGQKDKAKKLYEERILPIARATCSGCVSNYRVTFELRDDEKIDYSQLYKKNNQRKSELQKEAEQSKVTDMAIWAILIALVLNLFVNTVNLFRSKQLTSASSHS
jgi:hypothetical protein